MTETSVESNVTKNQSCYCFWIWIISFDIETHLSWDRLHILFINIAANLCNSELQSSCKKNLSQVNHEVSRKTRKMRSKLTIQKPKRSLRSSVISLCSSVFIVFFIFYFWTGCGCWEGKLAFKIWEY